MTFTRSQKYVAGACLAVIVACTGIGDFGLGVCIAGGIAAVGCIIGALSYRG